MLSMVYRVKNIEEYNCLHTIQRWKWL